MKSIKTKSHDNNQQLWLLTKPYLQQNSLLYLIWEGKQHPPPKKKSTTKLPLQFHKHKPCADFVLIADFMIQTQ